MDWTNANTEVLRITPEGDIFLKGRRATPNDPEDDKAIVDALRIWALHLVGAPVKVLSSEE